MIPHVSKQKVFYLTLWFFTALKMIAGDGFIIIINALIVLKFTSVNLQCETNRYNWHF